MLQCNDLPPSRTVGGFILHSGQHSLPWPRIVATAFGKEGFVPDPTRWSTDFAEVLADASDPGSQTSTNRKTIRYIRHQYSGENSIPLMRHLSRWSFLLLI